MKPHPHRPGRPSHSPGSTAWDAQAAWYDRLVGEDGSDYHREVVLPGTIRMLGDLRAKRILDLGCGQGVLCRLLEKEGAIPTGIDLSDSLIRHALKYHETSGPGRTGERRGAPKSGYSGIAYRVADACDLPADLRCEQFDRAVSVLSAGNMKDLSGLFRGAFDAVRPGGLFLLVVMHPCFRIPRQSRWVYDESNKLQSRCVDRYLTPLQIPILTHPGSKTDTSYTTMFHRPLHDYFRGGSEAGWVFDALEEWTSNRVSSGAKARAENRARAEFPLFLALRCRKG